MKTFLLLVVLLILHFCCVLVPAVTPTARFSAPVKGEWRAVSRTANRTDWESTAWRTNTATLRAHAHTNSYVELGAGINLATGPNTFVRANPAFQITASGAEATRASHKVYLPADIGSGEGIKVTKPDGEQLTFQPLGLNYFDPTDGHSVLLDMVTNAVGWLTASNEVVFSNCFTEIKASIRIRNSPSGVEHDVILHERPPDPTNFGLASVARLEMLTEQLSGRSPSTQEIIIRQESDPLRRAGMLLPDFTDATLAFGGTNGMKMARGKAFGVGNSTNAMVSSVQHPVGKSYHTIENRRILIEAIEHRRARPALNLLPLATNTPSFTNAALNTVNPQTARLARYLPPLPKVENSITSARIRIAQSSQLGKAKLVASAIPAEAPSFVLDYHILNNTVENDLTLRGDTTYVVSEGVYLTGNIRIEGGTVVKFTEYGTFFVDTEASLVCDTTNYLPAVFTSAHDDTVGEEYANSNGTAAQVGGAFYFFSGSWEFRNVRFSHLTFPITSEGGSVTFRNSQMIDAFVGFECGTVQINVFNGLFKDCEIIYEGGAPSFRGEHVTIHNATMLGYSYEIEPTTAVLKNSLLVKVTGPYPPAYVGDYQDFATEHLSSDIGVFEAVEGGEHYLPTSSPYRNSGSTSIDTDLRNDLTNFTTFPPVILSGTLTTDTTLRPRPIRDTDVLDKGYHYPAVDYAAKGWSVENCTVNLIDGVVIGAAPSPTWASIWLTPATLLSGGTPTLMNRFIRLNQVQENVQARVPAILSSGYHETIYTTLRLRFTDISSMSGEDYLLYLGTGARKWEACHNSFFNGTVQISMYDGIYQTIGLTNNCFRSVVSHFNAISSAYFYCYNNLFKDGSYNLSGGNSTWIINDNAFDTCTRSVVSSSINNLHNAYTGTRTGDQEPLAYEDEYWALDALDYETGPLGRYYMPSYFVDEGSRNADEAGLYHFASQTSQTKEQTSRVDIGLHYVALDSNGKPINSDTDALPDYLENIAGDSALTAGESRTDTADSDLDTLDDFLEWVLGRDRSTGATGDTGGAVTKLRVFTPLK